MAKTDDKVVQIGVWVSSWFTYSLGRFNTWFWSQNIFDFTHYNLYLLYLVILL